MKQRDLFRFLYDTKEGKYINNSLVLDEMSIYLNESYETLLAAELKQFGFTLNRSNGYYLLTDRKDTSFGILQVQGPVFHIRFGLFLEIPLASDADREILQAIITILETFVETLDEQSKKQL